MDLFDEENTTDIEAGGLGITDWNAGANYQSSLQTPLLERRSKIMEELYAPDHLDAGGLAGQALVAILPALLGRAIGGARGGVVGSQAGLTGLDIATKQRAADRQLGQQRSIAQLKNVEEELDQARKLESQYRLEGLKTRDRAAEKADQRAFDIWKVGQDRDTRLTAAAMSRNGGGGALDRALSGGELAVISEIENNPNADLSKYSGVLTPRLLEIIQVRQNLAARQNEESRRVDVMRGDRESGANVPLTGLVGNAQTRKRADEIRLAADDIAAVGNRLLEGLRTQGPAFAGQALAEQGQDIKYLIDAYRRARAQGANFTEMERALNIGQMANLPAESATKYFVDSILKVDQGQRLARFLDTIEQETQRTQLGLGYKTPGRQYRPEVLQQYSKDTRIAGDPIFGNASNAPTANLAEEYARLKAENDAREARIRERRGR